MTALLGGFWVHVAGLTGISCASLRIVLPRPPSSTTRQPQRRCLTRSSTVLVGLAGATEGRRTRVRRRRPPSRDVITSWSAHSADADASAVRHLPCECATANSRSIDTVDGSRRGPAQAGVPARHRHVRIGRCNGSSGGPSAGDSTVPAGELVARTGRRASSITCVGGHLDRGQTAHDSRRTARLRQRSQRASTEVACPAARKTRVRRRRRDQSTVRRGPPLDSTRRYPVGHRERPGGAAAGTARTARTGAT